MVYTKPEAGKPILIEVGGQMMELRFTLKTLKAMDAEHSIKLMQGQGLGKVFTDPAQLAIVFTCGLQTRNPEVTQDWVEDNVDASMLLDLAPVLAYATTGRWPDMDKILRSLPNAEGLSLTGSPSGPSADTILDAVKQSSGS